VPVGLPSTGKVHTPSRALIGMVEAFRLTEVPCRRILRRTVRPVPQPCTRNESFQTCEPKQLL
jgi:hypothetical protein